MGKGGGVTALYPTALQQFARKKATIASLVEGGDDTAVVDYSGWYHKGKRTCAMAIFEDRRTDAIAAMVSHATSALKVLQAGGMKRVHLVRDGADLPSKAATNAARAAERAKARVTAQMLRLTMPHHPSVDQWTSYHDECVKACGREQWLEQGVCEALQSWTGTMQVTWEVAPFEADAQLAYLVMAGHFAFAITEDVDILIYGATKVLCKLGKRANGLNYAVDEGDFYDTTCWTGAMPKCGLDDCTDDEKCGACGCVVGLNRDEFTQACVLAGCDYWKGGLKGLAILTACREIRKHGSLQKVLVENKFASLDDVMPALQAYLTFLHQYVRVPE